MKRTGTFLALGLLVGVIGLCSMVVPTDEAQAAPLTTLEPQTVAVTNGYGSFLNTEGQPLRIAAITSSATGGVLTARVDMNVGGFGSYWVPVGSTTGTTIVATNYVDGTGATNQACRTIGLGAADYIWPRQLLELKTAATIANHTVFVLFEKPRD